MNIQKINFGDNNYKEVNSKRNKIYSTLGIICGTPALITSGYLVKDFFTSRKKYNADIQNAQKTFDTKVNQCVEQLIQSHSRFAEVSKDEINDITISAKNRFKKEYLNPTLEALKLNRKTELLHNIKLAAGIGLAIMPFILIAKHYSDKRNDANVSASKNDLQLNNSKEQNNIYKNISNKTFKDFKNISFCGIVDEIADGCDSSTLEDIKNYIKALNPTEKELQLAQKIAKLERKTDTYYYKGFAESFFQTEKEYRLDILKKEIGVPSKPPAYYRMYQKILNTKGYREHLKWPEYTEKSMNYERMINILNRVILENKAKEKEKLDIATKKQLKLAYMKYLISKEFLLDFNSDTNSKSIPNAILFEGAKSAERIENIKWLVGKANGHYIFIQDNNESKEVKLNQILTALEENKDYYDKNGKKSLLWVENFDKLLYDTEDNADIIGDLKDLLCKLSKEYKTTLLFDTKDSRKLAPIALQSHRVNIKINIDKEVKDSDLMQLKKGFLKANLKPIKYNGYRLKYLPAEDKYINLYRGDNGKDPYILWISSSDADEIKLVLDNIDIIKDIPQFRRIKTVQFPKPNTTEIIEKPIHSTGELTKSGNLIYECNI